MLITPDDPATIRAHKGRLLDSDGVGEILKATGSAIQKRFERGAFPVEPVPIPGDKRTLWWEGDVMRWLADLTLGTGKPGRITVEHEDGTSGTVARNENGSTLVSHGGPRG